ASIVRFCREQHIDLRIFISPAHAHQLEIVAALGGWPRLERGKTDLTAILARDEIEHPGQQPIPLYDFSGYSSVTTERVPGPTEQREMEFYWDSSHFKDEVGDWVLSRIFGVAGASGDGPADFGVRLTSANIADVLQHDRDAQQTYRRTHADDVATINALIE